MSYGLDERLSFNVHMYKCTNGWSAKINLIHPKMEHGTGYLGADLDFDEAIQGALENLKVNLQVLMNKGEWPEFIDTTEPRSGIPENIDRSKVFGKFEDSQKEGE